jgi:hypothetical protein
MWLNSRFCLLPHWTHLPPSRAHTLRLTFCGIVSRALFLRLGVVFFPTWMLMLILLGFGLILLVMVLGMMFFGSALVPVLGAGLDSPLVRVLGMMFFGSLLVTGAELVSGFADGASSCSTACA